jgi:hypothetical protein
MNSKTIQNLKEAFQGKICSIFTQPINRNFDEVHNREHFVVKIEEINLDGIWGTHPYNGTVSFFLMPHVIFLQEEIVLDPNNPEHKKMIEEYQKQAGKSIVSDVSPHKAPKAEIVKNKDLPIAQPLANPDEVTFVDIKHLQSLAKRTKMSYDLTDISKKLTS